jgi:hypothetical protein
MGRVMAAAVNHTQTREERSEPKFAKVCSESAQCTARWVVTGVAGCSGVLLVCKYRDPLLWILLRLYVRCEPKLPKVCSEERAVYCKVGWGAVEDA